MLVGPGLHLQGSLLPRNFLIQIPGLPHAYRTKAYFGPQNSKQELLTTNIHYMRVGPTFPPPEVKSTKGGVTTP